MFIRLIKKLGNSSTNMQASYFVITFKINYSSSFLELVTYTNTKIQTKISIVIESIPRNKLSVCIQIFSKVDFSANGKTQT